MAFAYHAIRLPTSDRVPSSRSMGLKERVWSAVAHAPALLVAWANAVIIYNHFYFWGPFLHDSGWFSSLVHRNGLMPRSPQSVAHEVVYYWGWHPSLLLSLGSALSYLFPIGRVDWYCVFQAAIYAPLALAVPLLVPKRERTNLASAALTAACSVAFAFSGQVLCCIGYPHFEIFSAAGCAVMLAALATGRERVAWIGLAMSIATREDGGLHAGTFLAAVLASDLTGRPFPVARRRVVTMAIVAFAATAILVVVQKKLFVSVDAWKHYLAGEPPYAHLTRALLARRLDHFWSRSGFIWMPVAGSVIVAVVRRDGRYLLGWAATLPWFLLNIAALQEIKGELAIYTGFPFVASAFWVGAYARAGDRRPVRVAWRWAPFSAALVGLLSLIGLERGQSSAANHIVGEMTFPRPTNRAGMLAFASELGSGRYGAVRMDPAMASFAVEFARLDDLISDEDRRHGLSHGDAFAFFAESSSLGAQLRSPFRHCAHVARTPMFFCTTPERAIPAGTVEASPLGSAIVIAENARRVGDVVKVDAAPFSVSTGGPGVRLERGRYLAVWDLDFERCSPDAPMPHMHIDIAHSGSAIAGSRRVSVTDPSFEIPFEVTADQEEKSWELRTFTGSCAFTIRGLDIRRVD